MNWALLPIGGLFVLAYGTIGVAALRRPLLARLAARQAIRRRWQSALLVTGLMVGTVAITASLVAADSERDSAIVNAQRAWGRVDLMVDNGRRFFSPELATRLRARLKSDSLVLGIQPGIEVVGSVSDMDRQVGKSNVRVIGFDPASQPAFGAYMLRNGTPTFGQDLGSKVLLSSQLADALNARVGDRLHVLLTSAQQTAPVDVVVAGIAIGEGPGSYGLMPAIFAPLATIQHLIGSDLINVVRISAKGDGQTELDAAKRLTPAVRAALRDLPGSESLDVREVKASHIQATQASVEADRSFLIAMSLLIVVAGAALVANLAIALAEERRPQLGILRALGLRQDGLVAVSVIEGGLYGLAAALLAVLPGIAAGQLVAVQVKDAYLASPWAPGDYVFQPSVRIDTLAVSIAAGALVTLGTLVVAAVRTSRMSIAAAVRDLPEPKRPARRTWPRRLVLAVLAVVAIPALVVASPLGRLLGGVIIIVLTTAMIGRGLPERTRATLMGVALTGWAFVIGNALHYSGDPLQFVFPFFLSLLTAVFGLSVLFMANLPLVELMASLLQGKSKRLRAVLRPPLAYLARRPLRTGLATGAIAVVLSMVTFVAVVVGSVYQTNYLRDSAGYDIRLTSASQESITIPPALQGQVSRQISIPTRAYVGPIGLYVLFYPGSETVSLPLYELSSDLMRHPPIRIILRYPGFDSDAAMWRAVETDPTWVVTSAGAPGGRITLKGSSGLMSYRIAGTSKVGILDGMLGSEQALAPFEGTPLGDTVLLTTRPGVDARVFARDIQQALFAQGVDAVPTAALLEEGDRTVQTRFWVFYLLFRMGLSIGVVSLGILALREVVERRHALGVMRALGFRRPEVGAAVMWEAVVTATMGLIVGCVAGGIAALMFISKGFPESLGIDGASMVIALILIYGAVVVVTIGPAWQASRLPPAQALRLLE